MSTNGASASKAPAHDPEMPRRLVNVQPARMDDLQPKYAARIQHDDDNPDAHGWYAGFSESQVSLHEL